MNDPASVTKDARRATRIVCSGDRHLRHLKRLVHRRNRRAARQFDWSSDRVFVPSQVTGWEVA